MEDAPDLGELRPTRPRICDSALVSLLLGDRVLTTAGDVVQIDRLLGEGGQGRVFEVTSDAGVRSALKWYKPDAAVPEQWAALEYLLERGAPDPRFLWPSSLVWAGHGDFGYLMQLRPPSHLSLTHLATGVGADGQPLDVGFSVVIELCRQLAEMFLRLHAQGLCYRDISLGNIFFDPASGDALVCDVDNVSVDDGTGRVRGTGRFMAPEIVADPGHRTTPSTITDRHSLAVLLFMILLCEHPLEGAKTDLGLRDEAHLVEHFGRDPLFSLDPRDDRNRPVAGHVLRYWSDIYPGFLRTLFDQAFTEGLIDGRRRVGEGMWLRALNRLTDVMGVCPSCDATVFWDPARPSRPCWTCSCDLGVPLLLRRGSRVSVVGPHLRLLVPGSDGAETIGRAIRHQLDRSVFGLHNLSQLSWRARFPDGERLAIAPGQAVGLVEGLQLQIGDAELDVLRQPLQPGR